MLHSHQFDAPEAQDESRRIDERLPLRFVAHVGAGGRAVLVSVVNVSRHGFMAHCPSDFAIGTLVRFTAPNGETIGAEVRWAERGRIGCRFEHELDWQDVLGLGLDELDSDTLPERPAA